ncbi:MAG: mechanosensitive ion channel family protein [Acidobacteria bacterium]|nr:mechanosensitive ion channel family protein [Acidobacteriota bacterium]
MNWQELYQTMNPNLQALVWFAGFLAIALIARLIASITVLRLVRHTKTDLDDKLVHVIRGPVVITIILIGMMVAFARTTLGEDFSFLFNRIAKTVLIVIWSVSSIRIGETLIVRLGERDDPEGFFKPRVQPLMQMLLKMLVLGISTYFVFKAWNADISGWLASAGIIGIAVGFAAKDTLANLFSGVFIIADAPYQIGDYIVLDGQERGRVTHIGLRSTRILTRDDVAVIVPNAVISNTKIINESGGPYEMFRVRVDTSVAYGSDIDAVKACLQRIADEHPQVVKDPFPRVRFRSFGDSGLNIQLLVWVEKPELRGAVVDSLLTIIYKEFAKQGFEIPYPKRDIYLHKTDS